MRECPKCSTEKSASEFGKNKSRPDGLSFWCKDCQNDYQKKRYQDDPEKKLAHSRRYHQENKPRLQLEAWRRTAVKRGVPSDMLEAVEVARQAECWLCGIVPKARAHAVDHCHETGEFRGILCGPCNTMLGRLDDDPEVFDKIAQYLRQPPGVKNLKEQANA